MYYLDYFKLPNVEVEEKLARQAWDNCEDGHLDTVYPCNIFFKKQLERVDFSDITIFYGGNGSGKSTLLNLIAQKLQLKRLAPFNGGLIFGDYVRCCKYQMAYDDDDCLYHIPNGSRIVTSDDVFEYMFNIRTNNETISENIDLARQEICYAAKEPMMKLGSLDDYEAFHYQLQCKNAVKGKNNKSIRKLTRQFIGEEDRQFSNGETAINFFNEILQPDKLYLLDEPENSLSPVFQQKLVVILENLVRYCGVQLIIATHSPFLLAMNGAKIYNLDAVPVRTCNWWELENTKNYFDFFYKHKDLFLN